MRGRLEGSQKAEVKKRHGHEGYSYALPIAATSISIASVTPLPTGVAKPRPAIIAQNLAIDAPSQEAKSVGMHASAAASDYDSAPRSCPPSPALIRALQAISPIKRDVKLLSAATAAAQGSNGSKANYKPGSSLPKQTGVSQATSKEKVITVRWR